MKLNLNSLKRLTSEQQSEFLGSLSTDELVSLRFNWRFWARDTQLEPAGDWATWLILAGRGFGKTRTGAEWVRDHVTGNPSARVALVGPTAADCRDTMIEGESGLMGVFPPDQKRRFEASKRRVTFANGAIATYFSAEKPERLRGPQHTAAWCDELCAWRYPQEAWDQLQFGLRLGENPRACITTTPQPTA
ncbi:MAG: DNA-packaging protein, partial [Kordiimonadaceae bacterium]|nr:DNA-packaging protein [Kordiimonadaceae bacterium]